MRWSSARFLAAVLVAGVVPALAQVPELTTDTEVSDTGYFRLSWPPQESVVTVEESATPDFDGARAIYRGHDAATVVSGRLDGTYHYRIRAGEGPWSEPLAITVRHHSLAKAFAFMAVGAVVFLATAVLIITGHRRHRREMAQRQEAP